MLCLACGASLAEPAVFPGATIRCVCGAENVVLPPARPHWPAASSPYRDPALFAPTPPSAGRAPDAQLFTCPFCGGPCTPDARACPHCTVELAAVRCPRCFALHFTGARFCSRCRTELHAEPLLDASDAPCPRCTKPLGGTREGGVFECTACGGLFVDHAAFAALCAEKEAEAKPYARPFTPSPPSRVDLEVHYLKCPACTQIMNRMNFGRRSGVIVDVCGRHGTWFDAGELTRVLEWIASGALADERVREQAERAARERDEARAHAALMATPTCAVSAPGWSHADDDHTFAGTASALLDAVLEFLSSR